MHVATYRRASRWTAAGATAIIVLLLLVHYAFR